MPSRYGPARCPSCRRRAAISTSAPRCHPEVSKGGKPIVIAVTGAIGAGKTTLASRLASEYGAVHLSSDGVRLSVSHKARRSGARVFAELRLRFERALDERRSIVLDSTGMSPRLRALLRAHRENVVHVHLLLQDPKRFEEREGRRTDRDRPVSFTAFARSRHIEFHPAPDLILSTDDVTAEQVYERVTYFLRVLA